MNFSGAFFCFEQSFRLVSQEGFVESRLYDDADSRHIMKEVTHLALCLCVRACFAYERNSAFSTF